MTNVADELQVQIKRVRDEILPAVYDGLGEAGKPAAMMMRADLDATTKAILDGDLAEMIARLESLKGWEL
jgi:hypothetical protein